MRLAFRTVPVRTHLRQPRVDWCSQSLRPSTPALPTPSFPPLMVSEEHSSVLSEPSLGWALNTLLVFISLLALSRNLLPVAVQGLTSCCQERGSVCVPENLLPLGWPVRGLDSSVEGITQKTPCLSGSLLP